MNESIWEQFAITEDLVHSDAEARKSIREMSNLDRLDDASPRWDLTPALTTNLVQMASLYCSVHVNDAVVFFRRGTISGFKDSRCDEALVRNNLLVLPAGRTPIVSNGPVSFVFDLQRALETFQVYRINIVEDQDQPLIRLMLSTHDLTDSFVRITNSEFGHPVFVTEFGFKTLSGCRYEFLIEAQDMPLSECHEVEVDPHDPHQHQPCARYGSVCRDRDPDSNFVRILALAITCGNDQIARLLSFDFGNSYLSRFRYWLKDLKLEFAGQEPNQENLHSAFVELANGSLDLGAEKLKANSLEAIQDFVVNRVATVFGYRHDAAQLFLS